MSVNKSELRKKTSITLKKDLWLDSQQYVLHKSEIAQSAKRGIKEDNGRIRESAPLKKEDKQTMLNVTKIFLRSNILKKLKNRNGSPK